ncbi:MAG TPA: hypothetical protein VGN93_04285 [Shinella sp.]|jgi:hypothetical protein|uniref:hypothetical protein n=1 Tax=Shinella sp. TaxID=1870904 RepID=UPI002E0EB618|nr:hypothetical protein [Shinella sp.]
MIDPPTREPGSAEREVELDQTVDYAIQFLEEEAHLIGWRRAEFLASIIDVANARLATLDEESRLTGATPVGDEADGKCLP